MEGRDGEGGMAGGEEKKVRTIKYREGVNLWLFPTLQEVAPPRTCLTFSCASIFSVRLQSSATWCTSCICGKPLPIIHLLIFHMVTTTSCCWLPEWWKVGQRLCSSLQISSRYKNKKQKPNLWVKPSQTVIGLSLACNPLWLHFPFFRRSAWMVRGFIIIVIVFFPLLHPLASNPKNLWIAFGLRVWGHRWNRGQASDWWRICASVRRHDIMADGLQLLQREALWD